MDQETITDVTVSLDEMTWSVLMIDSQRVKAPDLKTHLKSILRREADRLQGPMAAAMRDVRERMLRSEVEATIRLSDGG